MIGLDTNILVRMIVQDDPKQASLAEELVERASDAGEKCFVSDPVLCEVEWVLKKRYDATPADILAAMEELAGHEVFVFENPESLRRALTLYQEGRVGLADALIGAKAQAQGARTTYTFDRMLARQEGFSLLA